MTNEEIAYAKNVKKKIGNIKKLIFLIKRC
jgi:hypothetical protein